MEKCIKQMEAVNKLFSFASPEQYKTALNDFWEAFITHETSNVLDANERSLNLHIFKHLNEFMSNVAID